MYRTTDLGSARLVTSSQSSLLISLLASKSTFSLPSACTNCGIYSIRFQGPKVWNNIDESLKSLSYSNFKLKVKEQTIALY